MIFDQHYKIQGYYFKKKVSDSTNRIKVDVKVDAIRETLFLYLLQCN